MLDKKEKPTFTLDNIHEVFISARNNSSTTQQKVENTITGLRRLVYNEVRMSRIESKKLLEATNE